MKNLKKLTIILIMALIFTTIYTNSSSSAVSSDSANLTSMLNAYKKGNYKTAKKYAKKVKNTKYDASESKMTGVMTKAYANVLLNADKEYAQWGVYFADLDDDKKAEMILPYGTCLADMQGYVYKYKNGKAVYVDKFYCGNYSFINYPGHKGIIIHYTHMGYETFSTIYLKNGKIKSTDYGSRDAGMDDYVNLKTLSYHMTSNGNWNL